MASVLVVGPHPDDQELGMGGTVALLAAQGHRVMLLDLTDGEPTPRGDRATRLAEAAEAARALSAPGNEVRRVLLDLPNRRIEQTVEARHKVAGVMRAVGAEVVFVPYFEDAHPDHVAGTRIVEDARFDAKLTGVSMPGDLGKPPVYPVWLFYYFATHLRMVARPSFIVDVSAHVEQKRRAIGAYRSQFELNEKNRGLPGVVAACDVYLGSRVRAAAGEGFYSREPLGLTGLSGVCGV